MLAIPKAAGNQYTSAFGQECPEAKTKTETIKELGYSERESKDYQTMAKNPEVVQRVIDEAIANGDVVTKTQGGELGRSRRAVGMMDDAMHGRHQASA